MECCVLCYPKVIWDSHNICLYFKTSEVYRQINTAWIKCRFIVHSVLCNKQQNKEFPPKRTAGWQTKAQPPENGINPSLITTKALSLQEIFPLSRPVAGVTDMGNFPAVCLPGKGVTSGGIHLLEDEELWPNNKINVGKGLPIQQNVTAIKIPENARELDSQDSSSCTSLCLTWHPSTCTSCSLYKNSPKVCSEENETRKRHYHYSGLLKSTHAIF